MTRDRGIEFTPCWLSRIVAALSCASAYAMAMLCVAFVVTSCCRGPAVRPPITVTTVDRACVEDVQQSIPEPDRKNWFQQCERWETCLNLESAEALAEWIELALAYQSAVQLACGVRPAPEEK